MKQCSFGGKNKKRKEKVKLFHTPTPISTKREEFGHERKKRVPHPKQEIKKELPGIGFYITY